jgi:hypothetical protein
MKKRTLSKLASYLAGGFGFITLPKTFVVLTDHPKWIGMVNDIGLNVSCFLLGSNLGVDGLRAPLKPVYFQVGCSAHHSL